MPAVARLRGRRSGYFLLHDSVPPRKLLRCPLSKSNGFRTDGAGGLYLHWHSRTFLGEDRRSRLPRRPRASTATTAGRAAAPGPWPTTRSIPGPGDHADCRCKRVPSAVAAGASGGTWEPARLLRAAPPQTSTPACRPPHTGRMGTGRVEGKVLLRSSGLEVTVSASHVPGSHRAGAPCWVGVQGALPGPAGDQQWRMTALQRCA